MSFLDVVKNKIKNMVLEKKEHNALMTKKIKERDDLLEKKKNDWIKSVINNIPKKLKDNNFWNNGVVVWSTYDSKQDFEVSVPNSNYKRVVILKNDALALFQAVSKLGYKCTFKYNERSNTENPYNHFYEEWVEILIFPYESE